MGTAKRRVSLAGLAVLAAAATVGISPASSGATGTTTFTQTNLVSDQAGVAAIQDPNLVNAWGLAHGPNTPLWVSDNGADVSTIYTGATGGQPVMRVPLVVSIPGGAPTGQVFNDTTGFVVRGTGKPAAFIFAGEGGGISAWNGSVYNTSQAAVAAPSLGGVYKGLALVHSPFGPLLLATDFHNNKVDVFNSTFHRLPVHLLFSDPKIPAGFAPFNVAEIGSRVFVTYAKQDAAKHDDVAGAGHGFVDEYTNYGALERRFASRGALNSPWALLVAPPSFGSYAGDLLVGNFGDGRINAFDVHTGAFVGALTGADNQPLVIDGLWGLITGDAVAGGADSVWFSAGPMGESHGLLGTLQAN